MTNNLTKRQHYVPQFYLQSWLDPKDGKGLHYYDLIYKKSKRKFTKEILWEEYLYEEDPSIPDNKVEKMLERYEDEAAPIIAQLNDIIDHFSRTKKEKKCKNKIESFLSGNNLEILKDFAAFQYLRLKHAVAQKEFELKPSSLTEEEKRKYFNPGYFVESGYAHIRKHFDNLIVSICFIFKGELFTSDWPFFDMRDSDYAPILGEELGVEDDVVGQFPLTPNLMAIFLPRGFYLDKRAAMLPSCVAKKLTKSEVNNFNELTIQKAMRYVVTKTDNEKFVFDVAAKRKREVNPELFS